MTSDREPHPQQLHEKSLTDAYKAGFEDGCATHSSTPAGDEQCLELIKIAMLEGIKAGSKSAREQVLDEFLDEVRKEEFDNCGYVDMDSIEAVYIRMKESLRAQQQNNTSMTAP